MKNRNYNLSIDPVTRDWPPVMDIPGVESFGDFGTLDEALAAAGPIVGEWVDATTGFVEECWARRVDGGAAVVTRLYRLDRIDVEVGVLGQ